ncbi:hypothetical protein BCR43DRAFT_523251 [Syncephalastrum racemosum]|uniref:F-box domain-containing protein n=1 Tax=Syncephalastrum racemosum TaxID=13706 RepID=A0A1X2HJQ2_SYNRA|nr:hypothetical protein BCR43DRAFT_523251 [Syncephalastrum racemosum]
MSASKETNKSLHFEDHLQTALEAARLEGYDSAADQLRDLLCQTLETKVGLCLRSLQPQDALAHAKRYAEIAPSHYGLLFLCKTYCTLGYYRDAEITGRCGLIKVAADQRETMQYFTDTVHIHHMRRRDPIEHFPPEVLLPIMMYLPSDRMACLGVSRAWRRCVQQLPLWQDLEVKKRLNAQQVQAVLRPELRNLRWYPELLTPCQFLTSLAENGCNRIEKSDINIGYNDQTVDDTQGLFLDKQPRHGNVRFFRSLVHIGEYLTELNLHMTFRPHLIVRTLLAGLPQIISLSCDDCDGPLENGEFPDIPLPTSVKLRHLKCTGAYIKLEELDFIPDIAPQLRSFVFSVKKMQLDLYNPLLERFQHMCPSLQAFDCSEILGHPTSQKWFASYYDREDHDPSEGGLRFFGVYPDAFNGDNGIGNWIGNWIFRNQDHLDVLFCEFYNLNAHGRRPADMIPRCRRLEALHIKNDFPPSLGQLPEFLLSCSQLKSLVLHKMQPTEECMRAIGRLPYLELVQISGCRFLDPAPLLAFLQGCRSKIKALDIDIVGDRYPLNEQLFAALGTMNTLKFLRLRVCHEFEFDLEGEVYMLPTACLYALMMNAVKSGLDQGLEHLYYTHDVMVFQDRYMGIFLRAVFENAIHGDSRSAHEDIIEKYRP